MTLHIKLRPTSLKTESYGEMAVPLLNHLNSVSVYESLQSVGFANITRKQNVEEKKCIFVVSLGKYSYIPRPIHTNTHTHTNVYRAYIYYVSLYTYTAAVHPAQRGSSQV